MSGLVGENVRDSLCGLLICVVLGNYAIGSDFAWEATPLSTNWNGPANWAGPLGQFPDGSNDTASVVGANAMSPVLDQDRTIGGLDISLAADVHTGDGVNNHRLEVTDAGPHAGTINIMDAGSELFIYEQAGFDLVADVINTSNGGRLAPVDGGDVLVREILNNSGLIFGAGTVQLQGGVSTNDGTVVAEAGTLVIDTVGSASFDPDGSFGAGSLQANIDDTLMILGPLQDSTFNGVISMANGGEIHIEQAWNLANTPGALLLFLGGAAPKVLSGGAAFLDGPVQVFGGLTRFESSVTFGANADVQMNHNAALEFASPTFVANPASFDMSGNNTELIVSSHVTIGTGNGNFNWDGLGDVTTTIAPDSSLTIDVDAVDQAGNEFNGALFLNSGRLHVSNAAGQWEMAGDLVMDMTMGMPEIDGDTMLLTGTLQATGSQQRLLASTIFGSSSIVDVPNGASHLIIGGQSAVINGGDWTGGGVVVLNPDTTTVTSDTVVNMPNGRFDLDGSGNNTVILNAALSLIVDEYDHGNSVDGTLVLNPNGQLELQLTSPQHVFRTIGDVVLNGSGGGLTSLHFLGNEVILKGNTAVSGSSTSHSPLTIDGPIQMAANAEITLQGGTVDTPNRLGNSAVFSGSGDVKVGAGVPLLISENATLDVNVNNSGRVELGLEDTGVVLINGSYVQNATGSLGFDIAAISGSDQDWLQATGIAALDGELEVSTVGSFVPVPGDTYTVVTAMTRVGTFDSLIFNTPNAVTVNGAMVYSGTSAFVNIMDV